MIVGKECSLLALSLLGGLGGLAGLLLAGDLLDDTDGDGLTHVSDGETTKRSVGGESLDDHRLGGDELDHGGILGFNVLGLILSDGTSTLVDLGSELLELAGNMASMAIKDGSVTILDLTGMVEHDDLGDEHLGISARVVLGVRSDITSLDVLDGEVLDVEADVITGVGSLDLLVMHLDGLDLGGDVHGAEGDDHTGTEGTSLDTTDGYCSNTANLVDVLEGKTEGLVDGSLGGSESIEGGEEGGASVPWHVLGLLNHVIANPTGDGDEGDVGNVVADLLQVDGELTLDLIETGLRVVDGGVVHLVDSDDHLLDSHGLGEESVLTGLAILGEASFETTDIRGDHEDGGIGLGGTSNHVLDEISVTWGIDDGEDSLVGLELPESDINGDTTLALSLQLVEYPSVLERSLTGLGGLLLELGNGTLIDTTALVDQVTSRGRLAGIDVTDNDEINLILLLGHGYG